MSVELLIISGLSGSGKSRTAAILEDMDYYCVDNMPVALMPRFAEFCIAMRGRYERVALVADIRTLDKVDDLFTALDDVKKLGCECSILFVKADVPTIVRRYMETRRRHPLDSTGNNLEESVRRESELLEPVCDRADYIIDTTGLSTAALQRQLRHIFGTATSNNGINVSVMSFGYKYGIPIDADIVIDVRLLPNPFYVSDLRSKSGLDKDVSDYVLSGEKSGEFFVKTMELLEYSLPNYFSEGKSGITIGFGCTGGRHRSVAVAHAAAARLSQDGYRVECYDRDIDR